MAILIASGLRFQLPNGYDTNGLRNNIRARMEPGGPVVLDVPLADGTTLHLNCAVVPYALVVDQPAPSPTVGSFVTSPTI
jgi:hypothetical protein